MADALCGPSNALQTFRKQTSVDRTLQQDRIAARQAQVENFRSSPGPNAGILDAEFEAFQAGPRLFDSAFPAPQLDFSAHPAASYQTFQQKPRSNVSDWASDFQSLRLDEARSSPIPQSQYHQHAPLQRHTPVGWHQDFSSQQNQSPAHQSYHQQLQQQEQQQQHGGSWSYGYTGSLFPHQDTMLSPIAQQKQKERQIDDVYDEAAFEKAFDAAGLNLEQSVDQRDTQQDQDMYRTKESASNSMSPEREAWLDTGRIGSDRIINEDREKQSQVNEDTEADELARTAGQLLDNVKGDQSRKFQESNFLSLMRQLRDKEVRVENDKLVDVTQDLHPGGENYPNESVLHPPNAAKSPELSMPTTLSYLPVPDVTSILEAADLTPSESCFNNDETGLEDFDFERFLQNAEDDSPAFNIEENTTDFD